MLCDACSQIPLEAFLRRPGHPLGNPWHGNKYILYDGPGSLDQLYKSSIGGCSLCTTFRVALDGAEPFWAMQKLGGESHRSFLDNSRDDQEQLREAIQLKVSGEGELLIVDGHRIAYMHWRLEELGFGKRYCMESPVTLSSYVLVQGNLLTLQPRYVPVPIVTKTSPWLRNGWRFAPDITKHAAWALKERSSPQD